MATSDDPPFLTVGTEVSAKYRGAFCEATIKVAKKLVKCKVSYSKGNTALVGNEVVRGTLKVGSPVEVRQPDGQYLAASVVKLTDQSTYTVVFDDGDERTLKRSSLCLKGGRHFDKSESLDNLPLTDPENFGTPVFHSTKKPSRKRRRCSQSPSRKEEENGKRPCSYPERFPVGKAVFLENDRRRSCWLPAVIVPAHYVMEESDRTPDTICLRSFKDGRFFASTKDELHDFAPDKEPLLSMLEGDVQPMYMCKPAIERAMAYLDTGELPWDMDLFDKTIEHRSATPTDEEETGDEVLAEVEEFNEKLKKLHESKGTPMVRRPTLGQKDLNLFKLYKLVKENGGMEKVTQELKWRSLYLQMGMPSMTNASYAIKQAYKKYLYALEMHEKGGKGGKQSSVKESPSSWTNQRRKRNLDERSSEERERSSVVEKPPAPKMSKVVVKEEDPEEVERLEVMSQNDAKSEVSDQDSSSQAENSSSNGDDCLPHFDGYTNVKLEDDILTLGTYKPGDRIKVFYGKGKNQCLYEAKIIGLEEGEMGRDYLVHYNGWNTRYDEWINEARIAEKVTGPSKATRPQYAKKKANKKKAMQTRASSDGPSGANVPSPSSSSAPSSTMATPQQQPPHYTKRKMSESSNEATPTPLSSGEKLSMPHNHHKHPAATGPSCPLTPVTATTSTTGKMLNGGHLPSQQNHHPSGSKSGGGSSSNGKGSGRGAKRRRPSQATETPPHQMAPGPVVGPQALFAPNSSATSTPTNHIPAVTMVPNFVTPVTTPISSVTSPPSGGHVTDMKRIEGDGVCSVSPMPVFSTVPPVQLMTTTASQQPMTLNHKHTPAAASSKSSATSRGGVASGLNGSVCDVSSGTMSKNDRLGKGHHNSNVKVKRERSEERTTGWPNMTTPPVTIAAMRDFPPSLHHGGLKPEMAQMSRAEVLNIFPPHLLHMHNVIQQAPGPPPPPPMVAATCTPPPPLQQQQQAIDAAASALFCSERVPGMMSGDLKPVIQPVRHVSAARHSPSPRTRPSIPLKKIDTDAFSTPPESYSSIPQHPVDSPSSMSQSATELSPSPPCSPIHPSTSSSKKLHHSSSSSSLSSSLSGSAPSSAAAALLMGKNGVLRPTESTIQERGEAEEARIDMDESSAPSQDSPSSSTMSDNSSSEKERSPPGASEQHHHSRSKGSQSPDTGKRRRRSYETEEQYEERRKARRAKLNFMVDFAQLPVMSSTEKVVLIEEQMKTIQKKWVELKTEVNNLDRTRRKARKKEREAARLAASQAQAAAAAMAGSCGSSGTGSRHSTSPLSAGNTATSDGGGGAGAGGRPTPPVAVECH